MKKRNSLIAGTFLVILLVGMSACSNSSSANRTSNENQSSTEKLSQSKDDSSQSNDSHSDSAQVEDNHQEQADNTRGTTIEANEKEIKENHATDALAKVGERRAEFLERLDNIQKELDALPEKEHSDNGVTNAQKNYYGLSYGRYDEELNEIYALLKKELSPEIMKDLKTEQIKWIEQKEDKANEERLKYEGGTFESVAYYISLYESTKERSYELVNNYMID